MRVSWRDNCRTGCHIDNRLCGFHFTGNPEDGTDCAVFNSHGFSAWHDSLVLGALGCGAFCTPPAQMARLFHQVLDEEEFRGRFSRIVFAIIDSPSSNNFKPFLKEFSK